MKWIETITPKQAAEELGVPYHGWMREMDRAWISEDQKYSVMSRLLRTEWGKVEHVTITAAEGVGRSDGSGDIPWAVKMEIKNDLFGEKRVAVEVFPTQDRLVDVCDCYHLWVFEKGFQLPFGIHPRDKKTVTVNRGSTRVRAIDGAGREHSIKELLEENGAADVPKQAYMGLRRLTTKMAQSCPKRALSTGKKFSSGEPTMKKAMITLSLKAGGNIVISTRMTFTITVWILPWLGGCLCRRRR